MYNLGLTSMPFLRKIGKCSVVYKKFALPFLFLLTLALIVVSFAVPDQTYATTEIGISKFEITEKDQTFYQAEIIFIVKTTNQNLSPQLLTDVGLYVPYLLEKTQLDATTYYYKYRSVYGFAKANKIDARWRVELYDNSLVVASYPSDGYSYEITKTPQANGKVTVTDYGNNTINVTPQSDGTIKIEPNKAIALKVNYIKKVDASGNPSYIEAVDETGDPPPGNLLDGKYGFINIGQVPFLTIKDASLNNQDTIQIAVTREDCNALTYNGLKAVLSGINFVAIFVDAGVEESIARRTILEIAKDVVTMLNFADCFATGPLSQSRCNMGSYSPADIVEGGKCLAWQIVNTDTIKKMVQDRLELMLLGHTNLGVEGSKAVADSAVSLLANAISINGHCQVFSVKSHQGFILKGFHSFDYAAIL